MQSNYLHLMMLAVATLWDASVDGAPASQKLCGRKLGEIMSRVCHAYNSPAWDVPTVVEHPSARRKRHAGIADECCTVGCTWKQLSSYCAISANSESPLEDLESHMIEDRSAERASESTMMLMRSRPVEVGRDGGRTGRRAGGSRGYGRRRCWCRRRRSGRRRPALMGNMVCLSIAVYLFSCLFFFVVQYGLCTGFGYYV